MMKLSEIGSNIDGNALSSQSRHKLEAALKRRYFENIKSDISLWLRICNTINENKKEVYELTTFKDYTTYKVLK